MKTLNDYSEVPVKPVTKPINWKTIKTDSDADFKEEQNGFGNMDIAPESLEDKRNNDLYEEWLWYVENSEKDSGLLGPDEFEGLIQSHLKDFEIEGPFFK